MTIEMLLKGLKDTIKHDGMNQNLSAEDYDRITDIIEIMKHIDNRDIEIEMDL